MTQIIDINNTKQDILNFFKQLNEITHKFINQIEVTPIKIKKDIYITGFKRKGINFVEAHIKNIITENVENNNFSIEITTNTNNTQAEMWMDINLLAQGIVLGTFNDLKNYFFNDVKEFVVAQLYYKPLNNNTNNYATQEETIIYDNKHTACKETVKKRKLCDTFKSIFNYYEKDDNNNFLLVTNNNHNINTTKPTDEEIAEMP